MTGDSSRDPAALAQRLSERLASLMLRAAPRPTVLLYGALEVRRPASALAVVDVVVRSGDLVVDIGAHRGVFTARLARRVGPTGHVHAFEPNPNSLGLLRAVKGRSKNVTIHDVALSDHSGSELLYRPRPGGRHVDAMSSLATPRERATIRHDAVEVRVATLDAVLADRVHAVTFVKCDVEGHELSALKGAARIIAEDHPTILVEIEQRHQEADIAETFSFLTSFGYRGSFLTSSGLRPLDEFDVNRDQLNLLPEGFAVGRPAPGYVTDFLFVEDRPDRLVTG